MGVLQELLMRLLTDVDAGGGAAGSASGSDGPAGSARGRVDGTRN